MRMTVGSQERRKKQARLGLNHVVDVNVTSGE